jgi:hypothetical protein
VQAIEPVISPPGVYQRDNTVQVEFVHPALVGVRCAERGVRFMGMPGLNSGACADEHLITMPNPCYTITAGWYADTLCHELAHTNGWAHDHSGGLLFARHEPMRRASESPEASALAAHEAHHDSGQTVPLLASATPSAPANQAVQPLVLNLARLNPSEASYADADADQGETSTAQPLALRGTAQTIAAPGVPPRLGLRTLALGVGPSLPEPLP